MIPFLPCVHCRNFIDPEVMRIEAGLSQVRHQYEKNPKAQQLIGEKKLSSEKRTQKSTRQSRSDSFSDVLSSMIGSAIGGSDKPSLSNVKKKKDDGKATRASIAALIKGSTNIS